MNFDKAKKMAKNYLESLDIGDELLIVQIITKTYGWIFNYTTRKYIETGDDYHRILGIPTFLITKDGELHDYYIDARRSFQENLAEFELKHNLKHEPDKSLEEE